jgi:hypothetical protein
VGQGQPRATAPTGEEDITGAADPLDHFSFLIDKGAKVFVAGHRGLIGSAILCRLLTLRFTTCLSRVTRKYSINISGVERE